MLIPSLLSVIERKKTPEKGFGNTRLQKSHHRKSDGEKRYFQLSFTKPDSLRTIPWSGQRWLSRNDKLRISEHPSGSEWQDSLATLARSWVHHFLVEHEGYLLSSCSPIKRQVPRLWELRHITLPAWAGSWIQEGFPTSFWFPSALNFSVCKIWWVTILPLDLSEIFNYHGHALIGYIFPCKEKFPCEEIVIFFTAFLLINLRILKLGTKGRISTFLNNPKY